MNVLTFLFIEHIFMRMKRILDNFELVDELASGGMGKVYRAVQLSLKRPVAVKELKTQFASDDAILEWLNKNPDKADEIRKHINKIIAPEKLNES